jgi:hypothetical protein
VVGRLDLSRTHGSGYNNETYVIGTQGTLHIGRFCGYPGPIPVEVWTARGKMHEASKVFEMSYLQPPYAEFLPRFEKAYIAARKRFVEAMQGGADFAVTQNDVLKAQVFVEAAHLSAQQQGETLTLQLAEDLSEFRQRCVQQGFLP